MGQIFIAVSIVSAILFGAVTAEGDEKDSNRRFWGLWESIDAADGSTEQVSISRGADNTFALLWRESYWTICDGRRGILEGSGEVAAKDRNRLVFAIEITCFAPDEVVLEGTLTFDLVGRNMLLASDPGAFTDLPFFRVSGRVRGGDD